MRHTVTCPWVMQDGRPCAASFEVDDGGRGLERLAVICDNCGTEIECLDGSWTPVLDKHSEPRKCLACDQALDAGERLWLALDGLRQARLALVRANAVLQDLADIGSGAPVPDVQALRGLIVRAAQLVGYADNDEREEQGDDDVQEV